MMGREGIEIKEEITSPEKVERKSKIPRFAVIALDSNSNAGGLFNLLIEHGYLNVTFLNDLMEHPEVKLELSTKRTTLPTQLIHIGEIAQTSNSPVLIVNRTNGTSNTPCASYLTVASSEPISDVLSSKTPSPDTVQVVTTTNTPIVHSTPHAQTDIPIVNNAMRSKVLLKNIIRSNMANNDSMFLRLSNLTNHVRRHASVKQYQCVYCSYQHNEQAKVICFLNMFLIH
uniref:Response regulatory domain-containing protein n=1 Tax=Heterorhabditis bacteriophora TaxID=37862 RepID=A0A1I7WRC0_HETBA